jgi:hypothetical protein
MILTEAILVSASGLIGVPWPGMPEVNTLIVIVPGTVGRHSDGMIQNGQAAAIAGADIARAVSVALNICRKFRPLDRPSNRMLVRRACVMKLTCDQRRSYRRRRSILSGP